MLRLPTRNIHVSRCTPHIIFPKSREQMPPNILLSDRFELPQRATEPLCQPFIVAYTIAESRAPGCAGRVENFIRTACAS